MLPDVSRCVENSSKEAPGSSLEERQCDQGDTNGTSQDMAPSPRYVAVGTPELSGGSAARQHSTGVGTADQRDGMRDGQWPDTGSGAASHTTQTRDDHLGLEDRLELPSGLSTTPEVVTGGDVGSHGVTGTKRQWHQTTVWECGFRADSAPGTHQEKTGGIFLRTKIKFLTI